MTKCRLWAQTVTSLRQDDDGAEEEVEERLEGALSSEQNEESLKAMWTKTGLHKLWYPGIQDTSTWSKFGAHGEHGDVFLFSNLGAL